MHRSPACDSKLEKIVTISKTGSQERVDRLHEIRGDIEMSQFFFDVAAKTYVQYDYRGREFSDPADVRSFAELLALDMGCTDDQDRAVEVQVRNIHGKQLFSVPISQPNVVAA